MHNFVFVDVSCLLFIVYCLGLRFSLGLCCLSLSLGLRHSLFLVVLPKYVYGGVGCKRRYKAKARQD